MATENLTSKDVLKWKSTVDNDITKVLIASLKSAHKTVDKLKDITKSADENNLNYRFNDLSGLLGTTEDKLRKLMDTFDSEITLYANTIKKAEAQTAESIRKRIDNFNEAQSQIWDLW